MSKYKPCARCHDPDNCESTGLCSLTGRKMVDIFDRSWITANAVDICERYEYGVLTLRGLHYQLVNIGMTNSIQHYKRVVNAMIEARRNGTVAYAQFSDHDREMLGETEWQRTDLDSQIENAKQQIQNWMNFYSRNRWENQHYYVELWIEKKALQGTFDSVARRGRVALCPCKGYPSLTFLHEASQRFRAAEEDGKEGVIIYFGDHDPSGEDIPRSIRDNLYSDFGVDVEVDVRALLPQQVEDLGLPPAPTKAGDSRSINFTGVGQVELDAVMPETLQDWTRSALSDYFDDADFDELQQEEEEEREEYRRQLKDFVQNME